MKKEKVSFLEGKAFYAILFLCIAAIGVSGYIIFFGGRDELKTVEAESQVLEYRDTIAEEVAARKKEETTVSVSKESETAETEAAAEVETKWVVPVDGSVILSFSGDTLVYSETMGTGEPTTELTFRPRSEARSAP